MCYSGMLTWWPPRVVRVTLMFAACRLHDWAFFHVEPAPLPNEHVVTHDLTVDEATGQRLGDDITEEELESWVVLNSDFYDTPVPHHSY
jgi:hypothetical protein